MKEIFNQYGSAIIAILVGIGIIAMIFGISYGGKTGVLKIAGIGAAVESDDYSAYTDFETVRAVHERSKPEAAYISAVGRLFVHTDTDLLSCFTISDFGGNIYSLRETVLTNIDSGIMFCKILDIRDNDGNSYLPLYNSVNGYIRFEEAGIYYVCFKTRDMQNVTGIWKIPIAVDEGREND